MLSQYGLDVVHWGLEGVGEEVQIRKGSAAKNLSVIRKRNEVAGICDR